MGSSADRWQGRHGGALAIRVTALVIPVLAAVAAATVASRLLPAPGGAFGTLLWWSGVIAASTLVLVVVERQARRLLPLATLLKLTLVFPDRAPSRLRVALRAGTVRNLEKRLEHGARHGIGGDPAQAASAILVLAAALSRHDRRTRGHSERVRGFTDLIAEEMYLSAEDRDRLRWAALLHDIGKVHVHPDILNKHGTLSAEEWELIHRHPIEGARIVAPLRPWLGPWADAIEHHHERWDGRGYPHGLAGSDISLAARVVAVADAFEVMTAARSYRRPLGAAAARDELARCAGSHFDPAVVRAFLNVSLGRLRWVMAPIAWLAELPLVRPVSRSRTVAESSGAGMAVKTMAAVGVALFGGTVGSPAPPAPPAAGLASEQPGRGHEARAAVSGSLTGPAPGELPATAGPAAAASESASVPSARVGAAAAGAPGRAGPGARGGGGPGRGAGPPVTGDDVATVRSDKTVHLNVLANDSDPDGLDLKSLAVVGGPGHGEAEVRGNAAGRIIRYEPDDDFVGTDVFRYRICDKTGACSLATVRITVLPD